MVSANTGLGRRSPDEGGRISTLLPSNLIPSHQSVWVPLYDSCIIEGTHADVCISKGGIVTLDDAYIRQGGKMMT